MSKEQQVVPLRVTHSPKQEQGTLRIVPRQATVLPVRPRPYPDELLSSWLFRLAQGNVQKLHSLTKMLLGDQQVWNRDIDRLADEATLQKLSEGTGVSVETLKQCTLAALQGRAYQSFHARGLNRWILPLGVYHRTRQKRGLMYCPHCLRENPAFLKSWRLSFSVVCPKHGIKLLDACPQCDSPVIPHRVDMAKHLSKSLPTTSPHTACFQCGAALQRVATEVVAQEVVEWQQSLLRAVYGDGMIEVRGVGQVPVLEYLAVARVWLTLLTFGRKAERLRDLVDFPVKLEIGSVGRSFDNLDVTTRLLAVQHLVRLFEGWPDRVEAWAKAARLRRSILLNDLNDPPVWYLEALKPLEYVNPRRSLDGVALEKVAQERGFSEQSLAILQGYSEGKSVRQLAKEFGVSGGTVRQKVTEVYRERGKS